ncbi:HpcH/HpaI aldolase/citrate lyase family protein [Entomospira culicis]|uniref:CoA ester lyase n=1 Tax=Entomospira culicis TaxID=2719989 RepID=A0A968GEZ9_9SPIO|nr:CoA ester lyase [Entomospira culicis]NIZ19172.1 CoA ester lyase [Entomospira culicis]NIZ69386.1 CoA ester lyase [Entomospira culicis]WDI36503.1 CoA ester lyase [Entomospira culicis]WDI38129.1 CoA ester lyase [Entomospira culicis]
MSKYLSKKKPLRRSFLFCPANKAKMFYTAPQLGADALIFDLEDSVPLHQKAQARDLLYFALSELDFSHLSIFIRTNAIHTPFFLDDLEVVVKSGVQYLRPPMIECAQDILYIDQQLSRLEEKYQRPIGSVEILATFETPKAIVMATEIIQASPRIMGITLGAEDFVRTLGVSRSDIALAHARAQMVLLASTFNIECIDTSYTKLDDDAGFLAEANDAFALGFTGKSCLHPNQIYLLHQVWTPSTKDIEEAKRIMHIANQHDVISGGVLSLDGQMIDIPVIAKAMRILTLAGIEMKETSHE